jgi:competence protein ComEC
MWLARVRSRASPDVRFVTLAVGHGSAHVLLLPHGQAVCYDLGTLENASVARSALALLAEHGRRGFDALFVSHANVDHFSSVPDLTKETSVRGVFLSPGFHGGPRMRSSAQRLISAEPRLSAAQVICSGDERTIGGARLSVLWPPADVADAVAPNDRSLVMRAETHGHVILFTGDIERFALQELVRRHDSGEISLKADILVAPHHGSFVGHATREFFARAAPQWVVVSARESTPRLIEAIRELVPPERVLCTADQGAIEFRLRPDGQTAWKSARRPHLAP